MQPNQQSFNIFVVSHPVVHCTRYLGTGAQWAILFDMKISLFWKLWKRYV